MSQFMKLKNALLMDDSAEISRLVQNGIDINTRNSMGGTILHDCAWMLDSTEMIEHLVSLGADINARDIHHRTPLHFALSVQAKEHKRGIISCPAKLLLFGLEESDEITEAIVNMYIQDARIKMIDCLIKLGADVNAKFYDSTSLHKAIRKKNIQAVKVLAWLGGAHLTNGLLATKTALSLAVQQEEKEVMQHLVQSGADVNAVESTTPALIAAVRTGNLAIVESLLTQGADKNSQAASDITPISFGLMHMFQLRLLGKFFDMDTFTCLAHLGADFNLPTVTSYSAHEAMLLDKPNILECLVRYGFSIDCNQGLSKEMLPILPVIEANEFELLEHLVHCGADINSRYEACVNTFSMVLRQGNVEMMEAIVRHGYRIDGSTSYFLQANTPLNLFVLPSELDHNFFKRLTMLLHLGADTNVKHDRYTTALHDEVERGNVNMVKVLVNLGADVNKRAERGRTAVSRYLSNLEPLTHGMEDETVMHGLSCLVEAGADVNSGYDEITPLFLAVKRSDTRMVETLCSLGADMNKSVTKGSLRPLSYTCGLDKPDFIGYLIEHGADPNNENVINIEPLLEAVANTDTKMVECLLKCGANPTVGREYQRLTAIHSAIAAGSSDALKCLIMAGVIVNDMVSYGNVKLNGEATRLAESYGIVIPHHTVRLLTQCINWNVDSKIIQILTELGLGTGANESPELNTPQSVVRDLISLLRNRINSTDDTFSDLHIACFHGDLDIVRTLIMDGSDTNQSLFGIQPLDLLPLASTVDYHTLYETRTTGRVVERVEHDFKPILPIPKMDYLLCIPGPGDVRSILYPNSAEICENVQRVVHEVVKKCESSSKLRSCGSAAEGTKVGLPDEMDFLAEIHHLPKTELVQLKGAGHDYVHCLDETQHKFNQGSKIVHFEFLCKLEAAVGEYTEQSFQDSSLRILKVGSSNFIKDTNRKATSPLAILWQSKDENKERVLISIDVVPSIHVDSWPVGGINKTWLLNQEELQKHGYYIVPKPPHVQSDLAKEYTRTELKRLWKISFPHLETYHMQRLEKRVKDVYLLAKCLRNPDVCRIMVTDEGPYPKNVDEYITSYMLKMIFFKNVKYFLSSNLSLGEMVCQVYDEVEEGLSKGFIPLYFMPKVSAIGGHKLNISKCARVAKIMKKFVHALYLRDSQQDLCGVDDVEEVIVYQRKPTSVYRDIEIALPD